MHWIQCIEYNIILYYETVNIIKKQNASTMGPVCWSVSPLSAQASCTPDMESVKTHHRLFNLCCITCWKYVTISLSFVRSLFSLNASYPGHINTWRWVSLQPIASPGSAHPGHVHNSFVCWESLWKFICIVGVISQFMVHGIHFKIKFIICLLKRVFSVLYYKTFGKISVWRGQFGISRYRKIYEIY